MNNYPIVEMLTFFSRYDRPEKPYWRQEYVRYKKKIRSCHSKVDGGVKKSFYSVETQTGEIVNLIFNEEELLWSLEQTGSCRGCTVDRVLALVRRHKHAPSRAHRIIPYRFEIYPPGCIPKTRLSIEPALVERVQPYRFQSGTSGSAQIIRIETRHMENLMITKHLHYVVETDMHRFFHFVYLLDECDWRFMQEVDEEFFFVR